MNQVRKLHQYRSAYIVQQSAFISIQINDFSIKVSFVKLQVNKKKEKLLIDSFCLFPCLCVSLLCEILLKEKFKSKVVFTVLKYTPTTTVSTWISTVTLSMSTPMNLAEISNIPSFSRGRKINCTFFSWADGNPSIVYNTPCV